MLKKAVLIIHILAGVMFISGCVEDPSSIGVGLIGDDLIDLKVLDSNIDPVSQYSSSYHIPTALGNSEMIMLGAAGSIKSSILIRYLYNMADSIKSELNNNNLNVISASVEFTQTYRVGEANSALNFTAHKVNSAWTSGGFTADSLPLLSYSAVDEKSGVELNDSILRFNITAETVLEWLKAAADTNVQDGWGMLIKPTDESQKLVGYQALVSSASLHSILTVVVNKPGAYTDTLKFIPTSDISVVEGAMPVLNNDRLAVQSGYIINTKIHFDITRLPSDIILNRAELRMAYDSTRSYGGTNYRNSIEVYRILDSTRTDSLSTNYTELSYSNGYYTGDITNFIRDWRSGSDNLGLVLKSSIQINGAELFVLGGSGADSTMRPRLTITYTSRR